MHQSEHAHKDQVDRHDVVEQPWLDQDQDARDQGDYWLYGDSHQLRHGVAPSASAHTRADGFFSHNRLSLPFYRRISRIKRLILVSQASIRHHYSQTSGHPHKVDKPPLHIYVDQFGPHTVPHIKALESLDYLSFDWQLQYPDPRAFLGSSGDNRVKALADS